MQPLLCVRGGVRGGTLQSRDWGLKTGQTGGEQLFTHFRVLETGLESCSAVNEVALGRWSDLCGDVFSCKMGASWSLAGAPKHLLYLSCIYLLLSHHC